VSVLRFSKVQVTMIFILDKRCPAHAPGVVVIYGAFLVLARLSSAYAAG